MLPFRHRLTALVLALSHALVGVAGYALHELAPCHDERCVAAAEAVCSCGHVHGAVPQPPKGSHLPPGPALANADGHDAGQCALCALLAKFKVGHAPYLAPQLVQPHIVHLAIPPESAPSVDKLPSPQPRGPPAIVG